MSAAKDAKEGTHEVKVKAGTVYLAPVADSAGKPLEKGKTYKLRVPKDTPAKQF